jgi:tRNA(fMet)-specific endonuclease VapC
VRHLVDSDWLIDASGGIPRALRLIDQLSADGLGVSIVSVGEVYEGAFSLPDPASALSAYQRFLDDFAILLLTEPIMFVFGRIRSRLRRQGQLIPDMDLLIAATAIHYDLTLVTRNRRHFERIPELNLYHGN